MEKKRNMGKKILFLGSMSFMVFALTAIGVLLSSSDYFFVPFHLFCYILQVLCFCYFLEVWKMDQQR